MRALRRFAALSIVAFAITPAFTAHGQESLESVEYWKGQMEYMKDSIDKTNEKCGTHITFDWSNKADLRKKTTDDGHSPNGVCSGIFDELWSTCGSSDDAKRRVVSKVHSVTCGYGNPRTMSISSGQLTLKTNNKQPGFGDWAKDQLGNAL